MTHKFVQFLIIVFVYNFGILLLNTTSFTFKFVNIIGDLLKFHVSIKNLEHHCSDKIIHSFENPLEKSSRDSHN